MLDIAMMEHICLILFIIFFLSLLVFLVVLNRDGPDLVLFGSALLIVGSFFVWFSYQSEVKRSYMQSCFSYMAQTHPAQWEYENKYWKIVRSNKNIFLFNNSTQYTVEITEDGGFMVRDLKERIKYIVSKNGDVTSL